ncbi:MAG: hypothetical protein U1A27_07755 [Phycisphaerae bacterium]
MIQRPGPHAALIAIALVLSGGACGRWNWTPWRRAPAPAVPTSATTRADDEPGDGTPRQRMVEFSVMRIDLPIGALARADEIWRSVDEAAVAEPLRGALRANGFRVGVGGDAARAPILAILNRQAGARTKVQRGAPLGDQPMDIVLTDAARDVDVFFCDPAGHWAGQTFEAAQPVVRLSFTLPPGDFDTVRVRLEPELRQPPGPQRIQRLAGVWDWRPEYRGRIFRELAIEALIPRGGFLMLGPTRDLDGQSLLACPFVVEPLDGQSRENLLVVSPVLRWARLPSPPRPLPGTSGP